MNDLPLDGVTVLDLCIVLAGPTCGRTLAQYGANVIKVDPDFRPPQLTPWLDVGRGKQSIALNLGKPGGLDTFLTMAGKADVVLEGFRKGVADRLGIGYQTLKNLNPEIIYGSINCFGQEGPWQMRPGFEQNAQAATGIQLRNAGVSDPQQPQRPRPATFTLNDYGTGISAAYAVMLALLDREKTGRGQKIEAALSYTSATITGPYHVDYPGYSRRDLGGPGIRGTDSFNQLYECANDSWIFLSVSNSDELLALQSIPSFSNVDSHPSSHHLQDIFLTNTSTHWVSLLSSAGIPVAINKYASGLHREEGNRRRGIVVERTYGNIPNEEENIKGSRHWGDVTWPGNPVIMSECDLVEVEPPSFGGDTNAILKSFGISDSELANLRASDTIPNSLPIDLK